MEMESSSNSWFFLPFGFRSTKLLDNGIKVLINGIGEVIDASSHYYDKVIDIFQRIGSSVYKNSDLIEPKK